MSVILGIAAIVIAIVLIRNFKTKKRRNFLLNKYKDDSIVDRIMKELIWQGMSEEQLIDSWGKPIAKDHKVYKTKTSGTYKYNQIGKNRFGSRVQLENGVVVGWYRK